MPDVIPFPRPPLRLSKWARNTLLSLSYARPGLEVTFGRDDDGDEWALIGDPDGPQAGLLSIIARKAGVEMLKAAADVTLGLFTAHDELREAALDFLETFDPKEASRAGDTRR